MTINKLKKYKWYIIFLFISFAVELLIFNFRSLQSLGNKTVTFDVDSLVTEGMEYYENAYYKVKDENGGMIFLNNIETDVENICLDFELPLSVDLPDRASGICPYSILVYDADGKEFDPVCSKVYVPGIVNSGFTKINAYGPVKAICIVFNPTNGNALKFNCIELNARKPFTISLLRVVVIYLLILFIYAFRPSSVLWKKECSELKGILKYIWPTFVLIISGLLFLLISSNKSLDVNNQYNSVQPYKELAESLYNGQVSLLELPSKELVNMDNPYSYADRENAGVSFKWDTAYYNGKYYVYFGILPCLLFYLPFYAFTGLHITNGLVIVILGLIWGLCVFSLMKNILNKYYNGGSLALLYLSSLLLFFGCQLPFAVNMPDSYMVSILCALIFLVLGLNFWISAVSCETGIKSLNKLYLFAGSLCMALTVTARPQLVLFAFVAVPIFSDYFKTREGYGVKQRNLSVFTALVPFVLVAVPVMIYNYIRFDSVFEFGSIYNLTTNDIRYVPFSLDKIVLGLYEYLVAPVNLFTEFPFIHMREEANSLPGCCYVYTERMLGGLFSGNIILIAIFAIISLKKRLKERKLLYINLVILAVSLLILVLDINNGGIVYRYTADFSFGLFFVALINIFEIFSMFSYNENADILKKIFLILAIASLAFNIFLLFVPNWKTPLSEGDTRLYYMIRYAFNIL